MIPTPQGRQRAAAARATLIATTATMLLGAGSAWSLDLERPELREFIAELEANDGFETQYLDTVFAGVESKQGIIDAMTRPAEKVKPWSEYQAIFLTPRRISGGIDFFREHETQLRQMALKTGVPPEIITAIIGVETFYGTRTGGYRAVDALATLATDSRASLVGARSHHVHSWCLAQQVGAEEALRIAVCLHGAAADLLVTRGIGPVGVGASELPDAARELLNRSRNWGQTPNPEHGV